MAAPANTGVFVTFEGGDGAGKSTQIRFLARLLEDAGREVVRLREPGGTAVGEALRAVVLDPAHEAMSDRAELLIYEAARAQIVDEVIRPALGRGAVVLCDRFYDSTVAYQGCGRGLDGAFIDAANRFACDGVVPDATVLLVAPASAVRSRMGRREGADRLELAGDAFHSRVAVGFEQIAEADPARVRTVLSRVHRADTFRAVLEVVSPVLPEAAAALAGSNKTQAAYALAQALMCPKGPRGPRGGSCGACDRCGRILRRKHPDVRYFAPAGANGYLVEQVREIVADTALSPIQADKKIYILDRVDQLGASAANAFLKTLEEPADDVVMILLGRTRESVLPTIVSRCQVVPFRHIPASEAAGIVAQNTGADPAQARQAIEACGGSITLAVAFLRAPGSERLAFRTRLFSDLAMLQRADDWDVVEMARALVEASKAPLDEVRASQEAELAENADFLAKSAIRQIEARNKRQLSAKTSEYLRQTTAMVRSWLRDGLMVACGTPELVINTDVRDSLVALFSGADAAVIAAACSKVDECERALAYNVSPETCLDTLLFDVREVVHGSGRTD